MQQRLMQALQLLVAQRIRVLFWMNARLEQNLVSVKLEKKIGGDM